MDPSGLLELKIWSLEIREAKEAWRVRELYIERTSNIYIKSMKNLPEYQCICVKKLLRRGREPLVMIRAKKISRVHTVLWIVPLSPDRMENVIFHRTCGNQKGFVSLVGPSYFYTEHCLSNTA